MTRHAAICALGDFGQEAAAALPALAEVVRENSGQATVYAAQALGAIGVSSDLSLETLRRAAAAKEEELRRTAKEALRRLKAQP